MTATVTVTTPGDLDVAAVRAVAGGASVRLDPTLLATIQERRTDVLAALPSAGLVYGVSTGMGAQGGIALDDEAKVAFSERLMLGRAVGGPPWLDRTEVRALLAVRLRSFLAGDAGVSADLCRWLVTLLEHDVLPAVPRDASASAGEIVPLAHAFGHLARVGLLLPADGDDEGTTVDAGPVLEPLSPPRLGVKEGVALLQGRPIATALAVLRADEAARWVRQSTVLAAAELALVRAAPGPYLPEVAHGDRHLAQVLDRLRDLRGPVGAVRSTQVPVSFRVVGPVLAAVARCSEVVQEAATRSVNLVTDSPAYLPGHDPAFASTAGFHAIDLSLSLDALRVAVLHSAQNGVARLHRLLDPRVTGLSAQLGAEPGCAGLVAVHKQVAGEVLAVVGEAPAVLRTAETALGQEDVQSSATAAAEQVRRALGVAQRVAAAELLAVHQARLLWGATSDPVSAGGLGLVELLDAVCSELPRTVHDRPWGRDLAALADGLSVGGLDPSSRAAPGAEE